MCFDRDCSKQVGSEEFACHACSRRDKGGTEEAAGNWTEEMWQWLCSQVRGCEKCRALLMKYCDAQNISLASTQQKRFVCWPIILQVSYKAEPSAVRPSRIWYSLNSPLKPCIIANEWKRRMVSIQCLAKSETDCAWFCSAAQQTHFGSLFWDQCSHYSSPVLCDIQS